MPQSVEAEAELRLLAATQKNIISCQSSKPNIVIVQDSLLGAYRMTLGVQDIIKEDFIDISLAGSRNGKMSISPR